MRAKQFAKCESTEITMKICSQCILPETFPGVSFNADGLCSHCQQFVRKKERLADTKHEYKLKFLRADEPGSVPVREQGRQRRSSGL